MRPLTTIEALEFALETLEAIWRRKSYSVFEYHDRLLALRAARDAHRAQEAKDARQRAELRELAAQRQEANHTELK